MKKWITVDTIMRNTQDEELNESLGLDIEADFIVRPITINSEKIETYASVYDKDGIELPDQVLVTLSSTGEIMLKISASNLSKLLV